MMIIQGIDVEYSPFFPHLRITLLNPYFRGGALGVGRLAMKKKYLHEWLISIKSGKKYLFFPWDQVKLASPYVLAARHRDSFEYLCLQWMGRPQLLPYRRREGGSGDHLEDHPRTRKWLITMDSKSPK